MDQYDMLGSEDWKQMYIVLWNGVQRAIARLYEYPQTNPGVWTLQQILIGAVIRSDEYGDVVKRASLRGEDWEPIAFDEVTEDLAEDGREGGDLDPRDWKRMYMLLLDGVTRALEELPVTKENHAAREALVNASRAAEDHYISAGEGD